MSKGHGTIQKGLLPLANRGQSEIQNKKERQGSVAGRERGKWRAKEFGPSLPLLRSQRPHRRPDTAGHKWKLASPAQVN